MMATGQGGLSWDTGAGWGRLAGEVTSLDSIFSCGKNSCGFCANEVIHFWRNGHSPCAGMPCERLCVRMRPGWRPEPRCCFSVDGAAHLLPQVTSQWPPLAVALPRLHCCCCCCCCLPPRRAVQSWLVPASHFSGTRGKLLPPQLQVRRWWGCADLLS